MQPNPQTSPSFKDRTLGLILFGSFQILLGGFCGLMLVAMGGLLAVGKAGGQVFRANQLVPSILVYGVLGVAFVWLGIGSIRARRWARAIILVLAWLWLVVGVLAMVFMLMFMPEFQKVLAQQQPQQQMPVGMLLVMQIVMGTVFGCIYLVLPAIFVLFYRSPHVRATCEFKDPRPRWTDGCPLPVLALSFLLGLGSIGVLFNIAYDSMFPLFGRLLTGVPGLVAILIAAAVFAILARGAYRMKRWAWWGTVVLMLTFFTSSAITFSRIGLMEIYRRAGVEEQMKVIEKSGLIERVEQMMPWMMALCGIAYLGYMLYVRRYFTTRT